MYGDGPRTLGQAGERGYANLEWENDCAAREKYAEAANLQFLAVERWLDVAYVSSPDCRARFFFVTSLREPLARYRSHLAFEHVSEEDAVAWAEQLQVPRDDPVRRGTAVVDNFYVRSLLGREFFFGTGAGNVTLADVSAEINQCVRPAWRYYLLFWQPRCSTRVLGVLARGIHPNV